MRIRQLSADNPADVQAFVQLPYRLYADNPLWVPQMRADLRNALDPKTHPFYQAGEAAFFLAEDGGEVVGRIGAIDNLRYNQHNNSHTGFFSYFECVNDQSVAAALFEAAFSWLTDRGLTEILGPKGLLQGDGAGMLVEGFDHRPAMGIPYNQPYYPSMMEKLRFEKATDYMSGYLERGYQLPERVHQIVERIKERRGYRVQRFQTKDELRQWLPRVKKVYNQSFGQAFQGPIGFTPMTEQEIETMANRLLSLARPDLIKLILQGDELIGFLFAYPNIGPGLRRASGKMWPFGWLHLLWEMRTTVWLDINGIGILPAHQGRGANAVLYTELEETVQGTRFQHADVVQIREENLKSMGDMNALGVHWYKRHRLYRRDLPGSKEQPE
ncbi:MAG: hypothetical protein WBR18_01010 [Anaerolineales bacterium]